jgi:Zn-dependent peptidase ImmA (M78 family)
MPRLPVNNAVLRWALEDAELTMEHVTAITGKGVDEVAAWLAGEQAPHKGDLTRIAARVGRSMQFFFLPTPPEPSFNTVRFRGAISGDSVDPAQELKAVRQATTIQDITRWSAQAHAAEAFTIPIPASSPEDYAQTLLGTLHWSTSTQIQATSKSAIFKQLRTLIESLGVAVLYIDAGIGNCRGFSLPDAFAPLIAINSAYTLASLKTFTLLHELGHLAHGEAAVCHDPASDTEQWCDKFAAAFLMPEAQVRRYFSYKGWTSVSVSEIADRIRLVSNRFKASWQAVAIRLRELQLVDQSVVDHIFANSGEVAGGFNPDGGRTRPVIRLDEYGETFTRAILDLRGRQQISEFDARQQLRVNGNELNQIRLLATGAA